MKSAKGCIVFNRNIHVTKIDCCCWNEWFMYVLELASTHLLSFLSNVLSDASMKYDIDVYVV